MGKSEPSWDLYRTFLEVARDGSLSGAARRLALTQPTAGRHIDALEIALGVTLFVRSRRGLEPTAAARDLVVHVEAMASAHHALVRAASNDADPESGTLRLTASDILSVEVLPAILALFCERYPSLDIELVASNRMENLLRRDSDVAVRMQRPKQDAIVARRIGPSPIGLFAHRSYVERCGLPANVDDLARHRLIGFDRDDTSYRAAGAALGPISRRQFGYRCDSDVAQLSAIRAGIGIGGCQRALAAREADLLHVLPRQFQFELDIWVAMHETLRSVRRARLLFEALCDGLTDFLRPPKR